MAQTFIPLLTLPDRCPNMPLQELEAAQRETVDETDSARTQVAAAQEAADIVLAETQARLAAAQVPLLSFWSQGRCVRTKPATVAARAPSRYPVRPLSPRREPLCCCRRRSMRLSAVARLTWQPPVSATQRHVSAILRTSRRRRRVTRLLHRTVPCHVRLRS